MPLRQYLTGLGYEAAGWNQGFNFGPRAGVLATARSHVEELFLRTGQKVSLIGWSLGGVYAREMAKRDGVDIRYYSIIYDVTDDLKQMMSGMLPPTLREQFLGYADIRQVFSITKVGKVAGCMVTEGIVKRGAKVRLLRDNVVIHTGELSQLRRFKDDVKEVRESFECGMSFARYDDIREGDVIECFEIVEEAATL